LISVARVRLAVALTFGHRVRSWTRVTSSCKGAVASGPPPFLLFSKDAKPLCVHMEDRRPWRARSSTSVAIRGVPAGGPRHRRRRCATRTNEGTLKGTRLRLLFAVNGPPARAQGHHGTRRSRSITRTRASQISALARAWKEPHRRLLSTHSRRFTTLARSSQQHRLALAFGGAVAVTATRWHRSIALVACHGVGSHLRKS
jgi:hypothetical protein